MKRLEIIEHQLDRTLSFFARLDTKASLIFGIDVGLLAVCLANSEYSDLINWYVALPLVVGLVLISLSIYEVFVSSIPDLEGGKDSLFYFKRISERTEANFLNDFQDANESDLERDLLGQIWRNSQILDHKYKRIEKAFKLTLASTIPWSLFLLSSSLLHSRMVSVA